MALTASACGAIAGFGGGVIIKPVLDAFGVYPVSTVSFMSGCTVLAMSISSLLRTRKHGVKLQVRTSTPLALGAALGGIAGKLLFESVRGSTGNEGLLGAVQAVWLVVITAGVFCYICTKDRLPSYHVSNPGTCLLVGGLLGVISSFLGIGGGTSNVAILFLLFSMDAKEAAKNSIYIIMFSQIASILFSAIRGTAPQFDWFTLGLMMFGGVSGALIGGTISKQLKARQVELLLRGLLIVVIGINLFNTIKFLISL